MQQHAGHSASVSTPQISGVASTFCWVQQGRFLVQSVLHWVSRLNIQQLQACATGTDRQSMLRGLQQKSSVNIWMVGGSGSASGSETNRVSQLSAPIGMSVWRPFSVTVSLGHRDGANFRTTGTDCHVFQHCWHNVCLLYLSAEVLCACSGSCIMLIDRQCAGWVLGAVAVPGALLQVS